MRKFLLFLLLPYFRFNLRSINSDNLLILLILPILLLFPSRTPLQKEANEDNRNKSSNDNPNHI